MTTRPILPSPSVLFAMRREGAAFYGRCRRQAARPGCLPTAEVRSLGGKTIVTLETGIGPARAVAGVDQLIAGPQRYRPSCVIMAGYSGGLTDDLRVGDVLVGTGVLDLTGCSWPTTWPASAPNGYRLGDVLTATGLVGSVEEKRDLARRFGAVAVDMETAAVARRCQELGIPFGCVRVISDAVGTPLSPELIGALAGSRVSVLRVVWAILHRPALLAECWRLERQTRLASHRLAAALVDLLGAPGSLTRDSE